jgi:hypothetical protein
MCGFSFVDGMSDIDEWENDAENKKPPRKDSFSILLIVIIDYL